MGAYKYNHFLMKIIFHVFAIMVAEFLALVAMDGRTVYVNGSASVNGDGSQATPYASINEAAAVLRPGDICLIAPGVYRETVRPQCSGRAGVPIVFCAETPGTVTVSGLDDVPAEVWRLGKDGIWKASLTLSLSDENQVFDGEKMLYLARWPNTGDDLLSPKLATMGAGTTPTEIVDAMLPDYDFKGARVWVHAPLYWSNWTTSVITSAQGRLAIRNQAPYPSPRQHVTAPGAGYYIFGIRDALDASNEWFYDGPNQELCLARPAMEAPRNIAIKSRICAFDLRGISNVEINCIRIFAATVLTDDKSESIQLNRMQILYPYHHELVEGHSTQSRKGVILNGRDIEINSSEVAFSSGSGVVLAGENNKVFNCYIHDTDYSGGTAGGIQLAGKGNIISHCTITRSGRSVIGYGGMYQSLIQYCDLSEAGFLTCDLGLGYGTAIEGGNSEVRYNWFHHNRALDKGDGLYYDHGTQNIITHHNLVTDVPANALLINHYAQYHLVYNNTFSGGTGGFRSMWGNKYKSDLYACRFVNNIFTGNVFISADNYVWIANLVNYGRLSAGYRPGDDSAAIDNGIRLSGINDDCEGAGPDIGAHEHGIGRVVYGHNFDNPPRADFTRSRPPHRNLLENSAFEHEDHLRPWVITPNTGGPEKAKRLKMQGTPDNDTVRIGWWSMRLEKAGEVSQVVEGLRPDRWYQFAGFLRADDSVRCQLGVDLGNGRETFGVIIENRRDWIRGVVRFKTDGESCSPRVFARRLNDGGGMAFLDDCGLVLIDEQPEAPSAEK
jgi:hypothetical protein